MFQSPKVGIVRRKQRENGPHPEIVETVPKSQGNFRKDKFVLLHLCELAESGMLPVQNGRRGGANVKLGLKIGNMRKPEVNSLFRMERLNQGRQLFARRKTKQSMMKTECLEVRL